MASQKSLSHDLQEVQVRIKLAEEKKIKSW